MILQQEKSIQMFTHVKIDEFVEKSEEKSSNDPEDYRKFIYSELNTLPRIQQITPPESGVSTKL